MEDSEAADLYTDEELDAVTGGKKPSEKETPKENVLKIDPKETDSLTETAEELS